MFCRSLIVLLSCFFWTLYCLFFFDTRRLMVSLVSSIHGGLRYLWYLRYTAAYGISGIFDTRRLTVSLVSSIHGGLRYLWYLTVSLVSSIHGGLRYLWYLWYTAAYGISGIFDTRRLTVSLVSSINGGLRYLWYLRYTAAYGISGILRYRWYLQNCRKGNVTQLNAFYCYSAIALN
jgi:hypothetical protein